MEIFNVENLTFAYPDARKNALEKVSFTVGEGEFVLLCGFSGCGKTTLLKLLKKQLVPVGDKSGAVLYCGTPVEETEERAAAAEVGFVAQDPESQTVCEKVWQELAFGLENLGEDAGTVRRRVAETASYFGLQDLYFRDTHSLSGGENQLLALASITAMRPKVLLLDEPTAHLDPIAASSFLETLKKLNEELGLTVVLAEHRLEEVFPMCDKVLFLQEGKRAFYGNAREASAALREGGMSFALPAAARLFGEYAENCPLTVKEGRAFLRERFRNDLPMLPEEEKEESGREAVRVKNVYFRFERDLPDILRGLTFSVREREVFCILGGNGAGKTTVLDVLAGLRRPYRGKTEIFGKKIADYKGDLYRHGVAYLPQDPHALFLKRTVREDLNDVCKAMAYSDCDQKIADIAQKTDIEGVLDRHPYDVSAGELQRAALAKVLLTAPRLLLLDEPTKCVDALFKRNFAALLRRLRENVAVIVVTHDAEFAAQVADRCMMLFCGENVSTAPPRDFFAENGYFTTAASRISAGFFRRAVTVEEVAELCRRNGKK